VTNKVQVAVIGSGPAGKSAAARAAETGMSHVLLEAERHLSNTIYRYQKGKHVMAEPGVLPLRSPIPFEAGKREAILQTWDEGIKALGVNVRYQAEVISISGSQGEFSIGLKNGETILAENVILGIGVQGNIRKLGAPGEDLERVQYQLDDPEAYSDEHIIVIGAGDAAIENALALAQAGNTVGIVNRRDEFSRAKEGNNSAILAAIKDGSISAYYNTTPKSVEELADDHASGKPLRFCLDTAEGEVVVFCDRVIARLGATPPRRFVESCGIVFPSADLASVPAVSDRYESNVPGLYILGALAGYPLIKQAMNQGYEAIEFIAGRDVTPADEPLLQGILSDIPLGLSVPKTLDYIQQNVPVLAPLTSLQLREFMLESQIHSPSNGEVIFKYNDYTSSFYSIVSGEVEIEVGSGDTTRQIRLGAGQFFGEMGLISGRRRNATVRASGQGTILVETPRRSMKKLLQSVDAVRDVIDQTFILRAVQSQIAPNTPVEELQGLLESCRLQSFKAGEVLFSEGDVGDALYLIRSGSVTVSREVGGKLMAVAYVPAGHYVGEMALISDLPRSSTVTAAIACDVLRVEGQAFKDLIASNASVRKHVEEVSKHRLLANANTESQTRNGSMIEFLVSQGLGEATDVLLIDESLCIRCDHCEKACADTHGNVSRLNREAGPTFAHLHVPTSCRHCEHPHCMKDCPPDAIHRSPNGEVFISDSCIGCGNCERNCPYGVIQMGAVSEKKPNLLSWLLTGAGIAPGTSVGYDKASGQSKKAVKCDMCKDLPGGPACVRACPTGAALRLSPEEFMAVAVDRN
jgi:CRP-like cAMP-binding protein/thioredoxin reductase/Fe-S-cluster-containing hydrogenase component 2